MKSSFSTVPFFAFRKEGGRALAAAAAIGCAGIAQGQGPTYHVFVDEDISSSGNGLSWNSPYKSLEEALAAARLDPDIVVIQVGGGSVGSPDVYTPTYIPPNGGSRDATFSLVEGVILRGGYAGYGAGSPNTWDPDTYISVLSGEIGSAGLSDNCYHVVVADGSGVHWSRDTVLEGFTVRHGNADGAHVSEGAVSPDAGGGLTAIYAALTVSRCRFTENIGTRGGGMYYFYKSGPDDGLVVRCRFDANETAAVHTQTTPPTLIPAGAGLHSHAGGLFVVNTVFDGNLGEAEDTRGGGVYLGIFVDTEEDEEDLSADYARLSNCLFHDNTATDGGGLFSLKQGVRMHHCTLGNNAAEEDGGGVYLDDLLNTGSVIRNSILWDNEDTAGANQNEESQVFYSLGTGNALDIGNTCIEGLSDWTGNGNIGSSPLFLGGPNYHLQTSPSASPCIDTASGSYLPPDDGDLDGDANTSENVPYDLDLNPRVVAFDTAAVPDMGCYEVPGAESVGAAPPVLKLHKFMRDYVVGSLGADLNRDGTVNTADMLAAMLHIKTENR